MGFIGSAIGAISNPIAQNTGAINNYDPSQAQLTEGNYLGSVQSAQNGHVLDTSGADATGAQQAQLAQALQAQAQGGGPYADITQQQLRDATARNQSLAAGQVASQKGLNPALAARLAAQNQASAQQQAAGQAAMMRGQGILSSQGQLSQALQAQRQQALAQQQNQLAQQQANTQALGTAGGLLNQQNRNRIENLSQQQNIGAGVSAENAQTRGRIAGGVVGAMGGGGAQLLGSGGGGSGGGGSSGPSIETAWTGGEIKGYANGTTDTDWYNFMKSGSNNEQDKSNVSNASSGYNGFANALSAMAQPIGTSFIPQEEGIPGVNTSVPKYTTSSNPWTSAGSSNMSAAKKYGTLLLARGGQAEDMRSGGHVPGTANVKGDSPKNDTVPAMLSPGEIVIPRSIALHPDAENKAKEFVAALKGEDKVEKHADGGPVGYSKVLAKHRELEQRMAKLEKHLGKKVK